MSNGKIPHPQMPRRAPNVEPPPLRTTHNDAAEEYARASQKYFDMVAEVARLAKEVQEWERRALAAEAETRRLEDRQEELMAQLAMTREQLTAKLDITKEDLIRDRDQYRFRLVALISHFETSQQIILQCLAAARGEVETPQVDMKKLMAAIEDSKPKDEEPLPSVVTAGPRQE